MKILFIVPEGGRTLSIPNLGLAYLSSILIQNGHSVDILDLSIGSNVVCDKHGYGFIHDSVYHTNTHDEFSEVLNDLRISNKLQEFSPDLIGLHINCGNMMNAEEVLDQILQNYSIPVILGGPEATIRCDYLLNKYNKVWAIFLGESEKAIQTISKLDSVALSLDVRSKIPGIAYIKEKDVIYTHSRLLDISELPFPEYSNAPLKVFSKKYNNKLVLPIQISRGCKYSCSFCTTPKLFKFRVRPVLSIIREIENNKKKYNCSYYRFSDSTINFNIQYLRELCIELLKRKIDIQWGAYARIDEELNFERSKLLYDAGCRYLYLGIESGNNKILKIMNKGINRKRIFTCVDHLRNAGIKIFCSIIVGSPGESTQSISDTENLIRKIDPEGGYVFIYEWRKGSKMYDQYSDIYSSHFYDNKGEYLYNKYGRVLPKEMLPWKPGNNVFTKQELLYIASEMRKQIAQKGCSSEDEMIAKWFGNLN